MTTPIDQIALASDEDTATAADWETATAAVLRKSRRLGEDDADSSVWEKLARTTLDGISVAPIGQPADLEGLTTSGRPTREGDWDIRVHVVGPDAKAANEALLVDLENGATSLWLELGAGLEVADLEAVLKGVFTDLAPVVLDAPGQRLAAAEELVDLLDGVTPAPGTNLGASPALGGSDADEVVAVARLAVGKGIQGVVVDAAKLHELGASDAQELGYSIAVGVEVLRTLTGAGLSLAEALEVVEFRYAATDEQFPTIAKLRAARRLWARVAELSGATEPVQQRQHVVTSRAMMSKYDPYVNMLRGTVAAFAAGVGGAEAVTVVPFDAPLGLPNAFGRRIARNTSSLLIAESHLAKVTDPAGGAYAVEKLTDDLAVAGWQELGRIEEVGGAAAALADGSVQARVDEVVATREQLVARRKQPITGVSEFPNLAEQLPERTAHPSADEVRRYGASFEALRDEPAAAPVFLATMGPIAHHTARATFASNLFAAGGVAVTVAGPTAGPDDLVAKLDGEVVACLAGTDAAYEEWGAAAVEALRAAGVRHVILAGKPGDLAVDDSCATGLDALAFLNRTREALA
ncbi:methylmalonyl-CoA mutase [Nocardioides sp. Y6]|uniref:Methylmalonyl-CoA mutase n=1 Tax=Nocardioides malaquae TaxID=2773426 RepID=A0ABR9RWI1_9ACTN|nr:methylmalonyl-CoA mutase family protein [Nocardioides malaquae]MBE7325926.1 methylmalonyl-CoA mutase [Nocardioides malaquae]